VRDQDYTDISCVDEWLEQMGWSPDSNAEAQESTEARFMSEYAKVRAAMWERHYRTLSSAEKAMLDDDTHPSSSWDRAVEAEFYLEEFRKVVEKSGFVSRVTMDLYHGNTIVFTVHLNRELRWRDYRQHIPEFYRGFQVFVVGPNRTGSP
jgi:hypothetical protein